MFLDLREPLCFRLYSDPIHENRASDMNFTALFADVCGDSFELISDKIFDTVKSCFCAYFTNTHIHHTQKHQKKQNKKQNQNS